MFCLLVGPLLCAVAILVAYYFQDKRTQEEKELAQKLVESVLAGEWSLQTDSSKINLIKKNAFFTVGKEYNSLPYFLSKKEKKIIVNYSYKWDADRSVAQDNAAKKKMVELVRDAL